ncbi:hypothetical protein K8I31_06330 [bacterium]|nr:hypothetical protein [bacterium]
MTNQPPAQGNLVKSNKFALYLVIEAIVIIAVVAIYWTMTAQKQTSAAAIKDVIYASIDKNPDILNLILSKPDVARKQIEAIVMAKQEIQETLKSNGDWENYDQVFTAAWNQVVAEIQPAEE